MGRGFREAKRNLLSLLGNVDGAGIGEDWVSRCRARTLSALGSQGKSGGGEREAARIGEDERGDEKVGRWAGAWAWPWPWLRRTKDGGVWGIIANMMASAEVESLIVAQAGSGGAKRLEPSRL